MKTTRRARTPRLHVAEALAVGTELVLPKAPSRHLLGVLRGAVGDALCLFNGDGHDYAAELVGIERAARVRVVAARPNASESPLAATLVQGVSRGDRMDATVRQAVELGATRIVPVQTRHGAIRLDETRAAKRHAHWQGIVVSACEQSGRSRLPVLEPLVALDDWLGAFDGETTTGLVLVPGATASLASVPLAAGADVAVVVGPESGLDPAETETALARGLQPVHLGPRVLRTETAGPAALAILQARHGDL